MKESDDDHWNEERNEDMKQSDDDHPVYLNNRHCLESYIQYQ